MPLIIQIPLTAAPVTISWNVNEYSLTAIAVYSEVDELFNC